MTCHCKSYNRPDWTAGEGKPEVIVPAPQWHNRPTICLDACIADNIQMLWTNGVRTLSCCCGHNREKPGVVVDTRDDAAKAVRLLQQHDTREWNVLLWALCIVAPDGSLTAMPIRQDSE